MFPRPDERPTLVVLAPDVLAKSFLDVAHPRGCACRAVLQAWRDGATRLAVTRPLLVTYLRLLRSMKVPEQQVRRWILWLTRPEKAQAIIEKAAPALTGDVALVDAAQQCGARAIVSTRERPATLGDVAWIAPEAFLAGIRSPA